MTKTGHRKFRIPQKKLKWRPW